MRLPFGLTVPMPLAGALVYLALAGALLVATVGAIHPRLLGRRLAPPLSFAGMLAVFFLPQLLLGSVLVTALAHHLGLLATAPGQIALALHGGCALLLASHLLRITRALPLLDGAPVRDDDQPFCAGLTDEERRELLPGRITWRPTLTYRTAAMAGIKVTRRVVYRTVGRARLRLDVYHGKPGSDGALRPSILYVHGGAWLVGTRRQSRFMLYELAAAGFTVFAVSYRLAPRGTLPGAIEDCKAAVAWVRAHAGEHGARGDDLVAIGGSAGGHLATMLALTPNLPVFQPGFEDADTRLRGAVILYGVTDLTSAFGEHPNPGLALLLERLVVRARFRDAPERFFSVSPSSYVSADAPPILLVHGTLDELVPVEDSRRFLSRLRAAGAPAVHLLEVPLGHHAFEVFPSPLHQRAVRVIVRFLESLRTPAA